MRRTQKTTVKSKSPRVPMTPDHPRWGDFIDRLCQGMGWPGCQHDHRHSRRVLSEMGAIDVGGSLAFFETQGGYCDCEVVLNVRPEAPQETSGTSAADNDADIAATADAIETALLERLMLEVTRLRHQGKDANTLCAAVRTAWMSGVAGNATAAVFLGDDRNEAEMEDFQARLFRRLEEVILKESDAVRNRRAKAA